MSNCFHLFFPRAFSYDITQMHMYVKVSPSSYVHKETPATAQPLPPGRVVFPFLSGMLVMEFYLTECKGRGSNSFLLGMPSNR